MSLSGNPPAANGGNNGNQPTAAQRAANRWFTQPVYPNLKLQYSNLRGEPLPPHRLLPVTADPHQESKQYREMADEQEELQEALDLMPDPDCDNEDDVNFSMSRALGRNSPTATKAADEVAAMPPAVAKQDHQPQIEEPSHKVGHADDTANLQRYIDARKNSTRAAEEDECVEIPAPQRKDSTSTKSKGKKGKKATTKSTRQLKGTSAATASSAKNAAPAAPAARPIHRMRTRAQKQRQAESEHTEHPSEVQQVAGASTTSFASSANNLATDSGASTQQLSDLTPADSEAAATLLSMSRSDGTVRQHHTQPVGQHTETAADVQQPAITPLVASTSSVNNIFAPWTQRAPIMTDEEAAAMLLSLPTSGAFTATGNGQRSTEQQREETMNHKAANPLAFLPKFDNPVAGNTLAGSSSISDATEQGASAPAPIRATGGLKISMPRPGGLVFASTKRKAATHAEAGKKHAAKKKKTDDVPEASVKGQGKRRRLARKSRTAATPQQVFQPDNTGFNDFSTRHEAYEAPLQRRSTPVLKRKSDYDTEVLRLAWQGLKGVKPKTSSKVSSKSRLPPLPIPGGNRKAPEETTPEESMAVQSEDAETSQPGTSPQTTETESTANIDSLPQLQVQQPASAVVATGTKRKANADDALPVPKGNKRVRISEPDTLKPEKAPKASSKKRLPPLPIPASREDVTAEKVVKEKATKKQAFKKGSAGQSENVWPELPPPPPIKRTAMQKEIEENAAAMLEEMHRPSRRQGNSITKAVDAERALRRRESPLGEPSAASNEAASKKSVNNTSGTKDSGPQPTADGSATTTTTTTTPAVRRRSNRVKTPATAFPIANASNAEPSSDDGTAAAKVDRRRRAPKPATVPVPAAIQAAHDDLMALRRAGRYPPLPAEGALRTRNDAGWVVGARNHTVLLHPVPHFAVRRAASDSDGEKGENDKGGEKKDGESEKKKSSRQQQQPLELWFVDETTTPPGGVIQREAYSRRAAARRAVPLDLTRAADVRDANKWVAQKLVRWGCAKAREDMRARKYADEEVAFLRAAARRWKEEWARETGGYELSRRVLADDVTVKLNAKFRGRRMRATYKGMKDEKKTVRPGREPAGVDSIMERRGILKELGFPPSVRGRKAKVCEDDEDDEDVEDVEQAGAEDEDEEEL